MTHLPASEYGIFLLPDKDDFLYQITEVLQSDFDKNDIAYNDVNNIPHVSIFQGVFDQFGLEQLKNNLLIFSQTQKTIFADLNTQLQNTQENIFLTFSNPHVFTKLFHDFFSQGLYTSRDPSALMQQVIRDQTKGVEKETQALIDKYGVYWNVPETGYHPHFTLLYDCGKNQKIAPILKTIDLCQRTIHFKVLGIGTLGFDGHVIEVLETYALAD